jgi:hypothetical protein
MHVTHKQRVKKRVQSHEAWVPLLELVVPIPEHTSTTETYAVVIVLELV